MFTKLIFDTSQILRKLGFHFNEAQNPAVIEMQRILSELGSIEFRIEFHPDGTWTAESKNIDGIITGGENTQKIKETIKDAIFTYFDVPPYFVNDMLIRADNEPVVVSQRVYATR